MTDLDDPQVYQTLDSTDMSERISGLPQQCHRAWHSAINLPLPSDYADVDNVLILGMGGSAIGGDMVRTLALEDGKANIVVQRDYQLPAWVNERTLVIASSYSGNTEETLSAFSQALDTPCKKLAITTGGRLQALASEQGLPLFMFTYQSEPRAAIGYGLFSILAFLSSLGLITVETDDVNQTTKALEGLAQRLGKDVPLARNQAKQLAAKLEGKLSVIYGGGILAKAADRWKTQINENAKAWALSEHFPELNHNTVVGYGIPSWVGEKALVVMLRSSSLNPRILARYDATAELLGHAAIGYEMVDAEGETDLSRLMSAVLLGDYVSYYLGMLNGVDPSPIEAIDYLKGHLSSLPNDG